MHTYEIDAKTTLGKLGELQFCLQCSISRLDLTNSLLLAGGARFPSPPSGLPSLVHLAALPCILLPSRGITSCWQHSHCSHWLPGASAAPAQPAAIWPPFPPSPNPLLPPAQPQSGFKLSKLLIPLMQPCSQAAGYISASQPLSSPVNPFSVLPALCFAHSFQFTWSKERACWNSTARTSCSALLPGSSVTSFILWNQPYNSFSS